MKRELKYCDQCGKQLSIIDADGDVIHQGIEIKGEITIDETSKHNSGSSYKRLSHVTAADLCSTECLTKRYPTLLDCVEVVS